MSLDDTINAVDKSLRRHEQKKIKQKAYEAHLPLSDHQALELSRPEYESDVDYYLRHYVYGEKR